MAKIRPIVYKMNTKQTIPMAIFTVGLGFLGVWLTFLLQPEEPIAYYAAVGFGVFVLLLTAFCIKTFIEKVTGPKEGLIITDEGIQDNTTSTNVGVVKWADIKGIREEFVAMNKMIRIDVYNAPEYIVKGKSAMKRRLLKNNNRNFGSPFVVTARALEGVKHDELFQVLKTEFQPEKDRRDALKANGTPETRIDSTIDILS